MLSGTVGRLSINGTYYVALIGIDHNKSIESAGKPNAHFKFPYDVNGKQLAFCDDRYNGVIKSSETGFCMNPGDAYDDGNGNGGGWSGSYAFKTLIPQLRNILPVEWRNIISTTVKYTDNTGRISTTTSVVTANSNSVFYFAEFEVFGVCTRSNGGESSYQKQYEFYLNGGSKIHYRHDKPTQAVIVFLRSPIRTSAYHFCAISESGTVYTGQESTARSSFGATAGFGVY